MCSSDLEEIARELSERNQVTRAQARDEVDELVRRILASLRRGRPVELPGVGKLVTGNASRSGKR